MSVEKFSYDNKIVKNFMIATVVWGIVGMLVGLIVALELTSSSFNVDKHLAFGRLRPLHTNAVIFAFVGNGMFMGIYYSLQRLCKARMFSDLLSKIHFWGWQLIIVCAALTLPFGITSGKEYAELEWPIDIMIALVWVIFAINMFGTILRLYKGIAKLHNVIAYFHNVNAYFHNVIAKLHNVSAYFHNPNAYFHNVIAIVHNVIEDFHKPTAIGFL